MSHAQPLALTADGVPKKASSVSLKYFVIPIMVVIIIAIILLAISLSLQVEIKPVGFKTVNINGGPGIGDYDIFFSLVDADQNNGPANGYVYFNIMDSNKTMLYHSNSLIRSFNFFIYSNYTDTAPTVGYHWVVPLANVTPGMPLSGGFGTAEIFFLALSGNQFSKTVYIPIPVENP